MLPKCGNILGKFLAVLAPRRRFLAVQDFQRRYGTEHFISQSDLACGPGVERAEGNAKQPRSALLGNAELLEG